MCHHSVTGHKWTVKQNTTSTGSWNINQHQQDELAVQRCYKTLLQDHSLHLWGQKGLQIIRVWHCSVLADFHTCDLPQPWHKLVMRCSILSRVNTGLKGALQLINAIHSVNLQWSRWVRAGTGSWGYRGSSNQDKLAETELKYSWEEKEHCQESSSRGFVAVIGWNTALSLKIINCQLPSWRGLLKHSSSKRRTCLGVTVTKTCLQPLDLLSEIHVSTEDRKGCWAYCLPNE